MVDTTGAGDQFAAGFLYGLTHGDDIATGARLGVAGRRRGDLPHRRPRPEDLALRRASLTEPIRAAAS